MAKRTGKPGEWHSHGPGKCASGGDCCLIRNTVPFRQFADILPRRGMPTDMDYVMELGGKVMFAEYKTQRDVDWRPRVSHGQQITLNVLRRQPGGNIRCTLVGHAPGDQSEVRGFWNLTEAGVWKQQGFGIDELVAYYTKWRHWAEPGDK